MKKLDSQYPTEGQMKEMWEALERGDDREILAVLQKRQAEMKAPEDIPVGDQANLRHAAGSVGVANSAHKGR